ncbi:hypothetical protein WDH52_03165 [Streptomyces sp. TRM70308]|uniref:hypothetical protein n=1 Tax=Streptomyces sp. TRM70308 TaxID=3131932 RepID=UPI003D07A81E
MAVDYATIVSADLFGLGTAASARRRMGDRFDILHGDYGDHVKAAVESENWLGQSVSAFKSRNGADFRERHAGQQLVGGVMRKGKIALVAAFLLAAAGGSLYGTGTLDQWQAARSLDSACGGVVSLADVQRLLGDEGIRGEEESSENYGVTPLVHCDIEWGENLPGMELRISKGEEDFATLHGIRHDTLRIPVATSAPIGSDWRGVVTNDLNDFTSATVLLECGAAAEYLWVQGWAYAFKPPGFQKEEKRVALARVVASAAKVAAEKWDCAAPPDELPVSGPPTPNGAEPVGLADASGTCAGIAEVAKEAREAGVHRVLESRADSVAPVEDCFLLNDDGEKVYRFTSLYDGLAATYRTYEGVGEESGATDEGLLRWVGSRCASAPDGLHVLAVLDSVLDEESVGFQQSALRALATVSAERKGCAVTSAP